MYPHADALLIMVWFLILGFFLVIYVVLDGFDLGVGILSLFTRSERRKGLMMTSLGNIWDANESWLVVVGGILFAAFPLAYGIILSALYIPIFLLLFGLAMRGVAFEFHEQGKNKRLWLLVFSIGSLLAAVAQGLILGGILGGLQVVRGEYVGGPFPWLTFFSLIVTLGVVGGYALLGATYLIMKTEGEYQAPYFGLAKRIALIPLAVAGMVTVYTPFLYHWIARKWFAMPNLLFYAALPALALFAFYMLYRSLNRRQENAPFFWTVLIFIASFTGLAATLFPYLVPNQVTIFQAASEGNTLRFMLVVVGTFIPIMLAYNGYMYRVFKGKIHPEERYGNGG